MNCPTGKVEHQTVAAAHAHADSIFSKDGHKPNVYICTECGLFHVGGGRASDRPIYRGKQIVTTARPDFVQKKIDKGRALTVEQLILEQLQKTWRSIASTAKELNVEYSLVYKIWRDNNLPSGPQRKHNIIKAELKADPKQSKAKLAKKLSVGLDVVFRVACEIGCPNARRPTGPNHRMFGKHHSLETRAKLSMPRKRGWRISKEALAKRYGRKHTPEAYAKIAAGRKAFWDAKRTRVQEKWEKIAQFAANSPHLNQTQIAALFEVSQSTVSEAISWQNSQTPGAVTVQTSVPTGVSSWNKGITMSAEIRENMSNAQKERTDLRKGWHHTETSKQKIREARLGKHFPRIKKVAPDSRGTTNSDSLSSPSPNLRPDFANSIRNAISETGVGGKPS